MEETLGEEDTHTHRCCSGVWDQISRWTLVPFIMMGETWGEADTLTLRCCSWIWKVIMRWRLVPFTKVGETGGEEDTLTEMLFRGLGSVWKVEVGTIY